MKIKIKDYKAKSRNMTATKHWTSYKRHRDELSLLIRSNSKRKMFDKPVVVIIKAYYKGKRHVDTSNIDDKIIIDGLMDAGILKDDRAYENPKVVKECYPESGKDKLEIIIKEYGRAS